MTPGRTTSLTSHCNVLGRVGRHSASASGVRFDCARRSLGAEIGASTMRNSPARAAEFHKSDYAFFTKLLMFNISMTTSDKRRGAIDTRPANIKPRSAPTPTSGITRLLELNTGGADIRLTKSDIDRWLFSSCSVDIILLLDPRDRQ